MFSFHSIQQYHKELINSTTTCVAAVDFFLARIETSKHLNAYTEVYAAAAKERALALDAAFTNTGQLSGPLHGVVIALKDVICYKDHTVTAASKILKGFTATYNATAVERLLKAGAIIIGNCNCDEFAMGSSNENSCYGKTLNALDNDRVPGGSSGGSAVAVQAGLCMVSLGSDTGGSVRQPADFCGIIGFKPTYGRISRYGLIAYGSSFDQIGIFGTQIKDIALILEVIAGQDDYDATVATEPVPAYSTLTASNKPLKIGFFEEALNHPGLDPVIHKGITAYFTDLKAMGHTVEPVNFGLLDYIVPAYYVLTTAEASSNLSRYDGVKYGYRDNTPGVELTDFYKNTRSAGFGREVKKRILLGTFVLSAGYFDAYFTQAQKVRNLLFEKTKLIFKDFDILILPTVPSTAFKFGEKTDDPIAMYLADIYTVYANLTGIPAISLPLFRHDNGMPYGLQAMANHFSELSLLQLSQQLLKQ